MIDVLITLLHIVVPTRAKAGNLQRALQQVTVFAQIKDIQESPQSQQSEVPAPSVQPAESVQPPMETDSPPPTNTSNQTAMEYADDAVVTVSSESPTPTTSSVAVRAPITPVSRAPQPRFTPSTMSSTFTIFSNQSPFSGTY
ncbi:hypothetical protein P9112_010845 [Eukaryota sp. TZLM1-RC]